MIKVKLHKELKGSKGPMRLEVNFEVEPGSLLGLYGPSGSGKTSILRMISGLMSPDAGIIRFNGIEWFNSNRKLDLKPQSRKIGYVFQDATLFPNMNILQNLEYARPSGESTELIHRLIEIMDLEELKERMPNTLSGGQQQRVALARALTRKPELLLLDEPLSALDREMRFKLQDYILKVHREFNLTTILVSHEVSEIFRMTNEIIVLEEGKIKERGTPFDIFTERKISGKFQFVGEIIGIQEEDVIYVVTLLVGNQPVRVVGDETDVKSLRLGDKVLVATKAFNPLIRKII